VAHHGHVAHHQPVPAAPGEYAGYHRGVPVQPMHAGYGYNAGYGTAPGPGYPAPGYQTAVVDPNAVGAANAYGGHVVAAPAYNPYGQPGQPVNPYAAYSGGVVPVQGGYPAYPSPGMGYGGGYPSAV